VLTRTDIDNCDIHCLNCDMYVNCEWHLTEHCDYVQSAVHVESTNDCSHLTTVPFYLSSITVWGFEGIFLFLSPLDVVCDNQLHVLCL